MLREAEPGKQGEQKGGRKAGRGIRRERNTQEVFLIITPENLMNRTNHKHDLV